MTAKKIKLVLEDGTVFEGVSFGAQTSIAGEVVFNTGMMGYPETLTDPSYTGQILTMTFPLVGNYGVPEFALDENGIPVGFESDGIKIAALVVSEYSPNHSHYQAVQSLGEWMEKAGVPGIAGIDTRALTIMLREKGSMLGKIIVDDEDIPFFDPMATDLVAKVSLKDVKAVGTHKAGQPTVVLVDCGCKTSITRALVQRGLNVVQVPHDHYFFNDDFDGIFVSNGPGDPQMCKKTVQHIESALALGKPILGICLGNQILSMAAGADTYKLKFGHRGQNQPCIEMALNTEGKTVETKRCVITSQNHGYAVKAEHLSGDWHVWFKNANDGTVEGIKHRTKPFWGVQFHPEANPGPTDTAYIFDLFANAVKSAKGGAK
ncbi:MAG: glutamine-hydrolyzing carbamoyl-phosphate synthase small subunit [Deltaproteobacteria bacterium]|nr:glutamine-hydrolyzing carbamoyl-phosphate synthase small subunit [Deltaproteobacteria bacterium]